MFESIFTHETAVDVRLFITFFITTPLVLLVRVAGAGARRTLGAFLSSLEASGLYSWLQELRRA